MVLPSDLQSSSLWNLLAHCHCLISLFLTYSPLDQLKHPRLESWRSEIRSRGWKNNKRENLIVFLITFSFIIKWDLRFDMHWDLLIKTLCTFNLSSVYVTLHVIRLLLFMLSIPPQGNHQSCWYRFWSLPFYNSKSFIPNGSTSLFGEAGHTPQRQVLWDEHTNH